MLLTLECIVKKTDFAIYGQVLVFLNSACLEYNFHILTRSGFQFLLRDGWFSQTKLHIVNLFVHELIEYCVSVFFFSGVSFSDRRIDPGYQPADGEINAFVLEILQKEMPSQLDSFKRDLEVYFKNVRMWLYT